MKHKFCQWSKDIIVVCIILGDSLRKWVEIFYMDIESAALRWLTTVLMEYKSTIFNSFEKGSKLFFPSLFNACLSLLPFYVKFEQLNVNKWLKWATEHPMRDWALVG